MKRFMGSVILAAALLGVPATARAGFTMGARLGLGFPGGELERGVDVGDDISLSVPIMFQLGGAFAQNRFSVEGFLELSPMALSSDITDGCDAFNLDCSALGMRVGVLGSLRFAPQNRFTPWLGVGLAYETLTESTGDADWTYGGMNGELMGGLDFKLGRVFWLGPFLSLQLGKFTDLSGDVSYDPDAGTHTWIQLGARGRFDF